MKDKEKQTLKFSVIDNKTGEYPDLYTIALKEDWAKGLMYCDMEGFSVNEDGQLILSDECGKFVYCPSDRFTVVFEDSVVLSKKKYQKKLDESYSTGYYFGKKETAEKIYLQSKAIVDATKHIVQGREYLHIDALKEIIKSCGVEIKE